MSSRAVIAELRKRTIAAEEAALAPKFNLSDHLFPKQLAFVNDVSRFKTAVCSRRSGKSEACVADLIDTCLAAPNQNTLYITLARTSAKRIIWPIVKRVLKDYKIKIIKMDNSDLSVEFDNGSMLYVSGAKDTSEIEKFRGMSLKKVYIDECQSFRSYIKELIDDVVVPAMWDVNGTLCLIGTPGAVPAGFFHDCAHNPAWANHKWTIFDNPWIKLKSGKEPSELLAEERVRKGITESDPGYRREALGEWISDLNSLVFKFDRIKNVLRTALPDDLKYVFGIDIGFNDADAIAVLGYSQRTQKVYLVEELVNSKQNISTLVEQIQKLRDKYSPVKMVMDAGALGKKIQEEIKDRHGLFIEAAEKTRKFEFIELLNDDLRTDRLLTVPGTRFEEDCFLVQWDRENPDKLKVSDAYHSDSCFVAGTKISTAYGPMNIANVSAGDLVLTRQGFQKVKWAAETSASASVVRLVFTSGAELVCTPNHPIFTLNRGFVAAEELTASDIFMEENEWARTNKNTLSEKQFCSMGLSSTDIQSLKERTFAITIPDTIKKKERSSIGRFGNFTTGIYLKAASFITQTEILLTTQLRTSNVLPVNNILVSTGIENLLKRPAFTWNEFAQWQQHGTLVPKALSGTDSTQLPLGQRIEKKFLQFAQSATRTILRMPWPEQLKTRVQTLVFPKPGGTAESTMRTETADFVKSSFQSTNTASKNSALGLATRETLIKKEAVYNLSVENCNEYFANGVLVHNCDAVLYGWRECKHFIKDFYTAKVAFNSNQYMEELEAKEAEELERRKTSSTDLDVDQDTLNSLFFDEN